METPSNTARECMAVRVPAWQHCMPRSVSVLVMLGVLRVGVVARPRVLPLPGENEALLKVAQMDPAGRREGGRNGDELQCKPEALCGPEGSCSDGGDSGGAGGVK
ncbi:hypothetical protein E2C01_018921 [Portunus trituberculatus]|uniref:Uncharacterized protein n=1 Tax=Portunus trituberculatus TaxID=210409 RepID=A0A5B7DWK3_PORTR|nr:hypothetical protein [Portunus trituberculatus]